jgi:hypothetical protein
VAEPQTGIRGYKYTEGTETSNIRDVASRIALLQPDDAPLLAFINGLKNKQKTGNPTFEWFEDDLNQNVVTVSAAEASGSTSFGLTSGQGVRVRVNDILISNTGESILVTAVSTDTLTVTRSMGGVAATAYVALDEFVIAGTAMLEGANAPTSVWKGKTAVENYVQIFRDIVELTVTQANTDSYGGNDRTYQRKKKAIEHKRAIEQAFLFGDKFENTGSSQTRRGTHGVLNYITTNITDAGGVLTEGEFEAFMRTVFQYHPTVTAPEKWFLCSPIIISALNFWTKQALQVTSGEKTFGVRISKYRSGHGDLNITRHWLLEDFTEYKKYGFVLDPENIKYRFLQNLDTKLHLDIQQKQEEVHRDEYRTHAGLQLMQEKTHGTLKGVTGFAA